MGVRKPVQGEKPGYHDDYEILPHEELHELRAELQALKQRPTDKTLQISMVELAAKVDKLTDIFEEAMQQISLEEGGTLSFEEKMRPLTKRMDKVLEQNSQIAEGIVAVADLISELKEETTGGPSKPAFKREEPLPPIGGPEPLPPLGGAAPSMHPPSQRPGPAPPPMGAMPPGELPPGPTMPPAQGELPPPPMQSKPSLDARQDNVLPVPPKPKKLF